MNVSELMFELIGSAVCGNKLSDEAAAAVRSHPLDPLYELSKAHDMAHIVAEGLNLANVTVEGEAAAGFKKQRSLAFFRYHKIQYELEQLCETLEKAEITHIPLKGSVLRDYYPEPWMRTSCDIDIFVKKNDLEKAAEIICQTLNYTEGRKNYHDISLHSESGVHLELHFDLIEEMRHPAFTDILSQVWDYVTPASGCKYRMVMQDSFFYFYHVAHMAKHFEEGGCGVRPFLDMWILNNRITYDAAMRRSLLERGRLTLFHEAAEHLSRVWFSAAEHTEVSAQLEEYILTGGVYGTVSNKVSVQQKKKGGRVKFVLRKIFPPFSVMKHQYPILQKHPWLTPAWVVRRWFRWLFIGGHTEKTLSELNANSSVSKDTAEGIAELYSKLGL